MEVHRLEVDERNERRLVVDDDSGGLHRDKADEEADSRRNGTLERKRNRVEYALADRRQRKRQEHYALHEHRQQRELPAVAHTQHDAEREERVETHARRQHERIVRHERHEQRADDSRDGRREEYAAARDSGDGKYVGVHGEDVRHRHERRDAGDDFGLDRRTVAVQLEEPAEERSLGRRFAGLPDEPLQVGADPDRLLAGYDTVFANLFERTDELRHLGAARGQRTGEVEQQFGFGLVDLAVLKDAPLKTPRRIQYFWA